MSRCLLLLVPAFSLPRAPAVLTLDLHRCAEYSPTTRPQRADGTALLRRRRRRPRIACAASVACLLAPLDCRRTTTRPVSSYALFQWWLLLSQHPGCRCRRTSFPTEHALWDLSRRSGLFPSRRRSLAPAVSLPWQRRPAFVVWLGVVSSRPRTHPVPYLRPPFGAGPPPTGNPQHPTRLHRYAFRGEPAISWFDWHFTPTHRSSPCFATHVGSGLHGVLPPLHPAHG